MSMRYAGFMAGAREDRLLREERDAQKAKEDKLYQRQIARDEKAFERQKELSQLSFDRQLQLKGITESKAQKKKDAALKKKVDAFITVHKLDDNPAVRSQIASGIDLIGADAFVKGYESGTIRINVNRPVENEAPGGLSMGTEIAPETVKPVSVNLSGSNESDASKLSGFEIKPSTTEEPSEGSSLAPEPSLDQQMSEGFAIDPNRTTEVDMPEGLGAPIGEEVTDEGDGSTVDMTFGNQPFLKMDQFIDMDTDSMERWVRANEDKYEPDEIAQVKDEIQFRKDNEGDKFDFSDALGDADTIGKLNALQNAVEAMPSLGLDAQAEYVKKINESADELLELRLRDAEKDGSSMMFFPRTANGSLGADGSMVTRREGKYYDASGNEVDVTSGTVLPEDSYEMFVRNYNGRADSVAKGVAAGVNAVSSLASYRQMIADAPEGLNQYVSLAGRFVDQANSIKSAVAALNSGSYSYESFQADVVQNIMGLSGNDALIAAAQLDAAYQMAILKGSSGQALSDRELMMNLKAVGEGLTNPMKVVNLIDANIATAIRSTETNRKTSFDSFISDEAIRNTMADTPIGQDFTKYLYSKGVLDVYLLQQVDNARNGVKPEFTTDSGGGSTTPDFKTWMENARRLNPKVSDSVLKADYKKKYGSSK